MLKVCNTPRADFSNQQNITPSGHLSVNTSSYLVLDTKHIEASTGEEVLGLPSRKSYFAIYGHLIPGMI